MYGLYAGTTENYIDKDDIYDPLKTTIIATAAESGQFLTFHTETYI